MKSYARTQVTRTQTTISIASDVLEAIDAMAEHSDISRSRLIDIACRRFVRWANSLNPGDLKVISEYESSEPTRYRTASGTMTKVQVPSEDKTVKATRLELEDKFLR